MTALRLRPGKSKNGGSVLPTGTVEQPGEDLRRLGVALMEQAAAVVDGMVRRTHESGVALDPYVEESFARVGAVSTVSVARWMAGEGAEVAREVGQEAWTIFGRLAAQQAAPLNEVTKRCLRWRDAATDVVCESARRLELPNPVLDEAIGMLVRSLDVTLVRICESFESERQLTRAELHHQRRELSFIATHDALTGLPNRALMADCAERMLARSRRNQTAMAAMHLDLDNLKSINDTRGHSAGDELLKAVAARLSGV